MIARRVLLLAVFMFNGIGASFRERGRYALPTAAHFDIIFIVGGHFPVMGITAIVPIPKPVIASIARSVQGYCIADFGIDGLPRAAAHVTCNGSIATERREETGDAIKQRAGVVLLGSLCIVGVRFFFIHSTVRVGISRFVGRGGIVAIGLTGVARFDSGIGDGLRRHGRLCGGCVFFGFKGDGHAGLEGRGLNGVNIGIVGSKG